MDRTARLFQCQACHALVVICSYCDRGHQYCHADCAAKARQASLRRAAHRYQSKPQGKRNNASRQARYRVRQKNKVTHQGSEPQASHAPLSNESKLLTKSRCLKITAPDGFKSRTVTCHFCGETCQPFLRRHFLLTATRLGQKRQLNHDH